jgi:RNA polymerase sigma factor (sigma-70 family)
MTTASATVFRSGPHTAQRRALLDHSDRPTAASDDEQLVRLLQQGDPDAITEVWRRHSSMVMTVAQRAVRHPAMAQEITQDVFTMLWKQPDRLDLTRGSLATYLRAVTRNRSVDLVRREVARKRREDRTHREECADVAHDDPLDTILRDELICRVRKEVLRLPRHERTAVQLAWLAGHPYHEVAATLDIPEGTAKTRIRAGLRRASQGLADDRRFSRSHPTN